MIKNHSETQFDSKEKQTQTLVVCDVKLKERISTAHTLINVNYRKQGLHPLTVEHARRAATRLINLGHSCVYSLKIVQRYYGEFTFSKTKRGLRNGTYL